MKATSGNGRIEYSWDPPASDGGSAILRYEYRHWDSTLAADDVPTTWTSTSLRTNATRSSLETDETYNFEVRAVNVIGEGPADDSQTAISAATKPGLPRRFEAQADLDEATIELSWRAPDDEGGAEVTGYHLQFKAGDAEEWTNVTGYAANSTTTTRDFDHETLDSGETYHYRIRALNEHSPFTDAVDDEPDEGEEDTRVWVEANATTRSTEPDAPAEPEVTFADGILTVDWDMPSSNGEPITTYKLRWKTEDVTEYPAANIVSVQAPITVYIVRGPIPAPANGYEYQILAVNSEGESAWSDANGPALDVPEPEAHPASGNNALNVDVTDEGKVTISWRMDDDADYTVASYELQWVVVDGGGGALDDEADDWGSDAADDMEFAAQALMEHVIEMLPGAKALHVRVRTVTTVGTMSNWPATTSPTVIPARAPDLPDLEAMIIGTNVILTWNMPESNGEAITQFELQFKKDEGDFGDHDGDDDGTGADGDADPDDPDNDVIVFAGDSNADPVVPIPTTYIHENLAADATYTYRIRAVSTVNDGAGANAVTGTARKWSAEAMAETDPGAAETPMPPGTPVLTDPLTANDEDGQIELSWTKPMEGTSSITGYELMRWNGSAWEDISANLGAEDTEYADADVELGKTYWYAIRALSDDGDSEWTQSGFLSMMLDPKAPDAPVVMASVDGQSITLSWAAPANNGSAITAYVVESTNLASVDENGDGRTEDQRTWSALSRPAGEPTTSTTFTHTGVTPGDTRYYRVRADNGATPSEGEWSEEVEARAAPNPPAAPTGLDASDDEDRQVTLDWTLAAPASAGTGGAPITSVEVRRWNSSTGRWDMVKTIEVSVQEETPTDYTSTSLTYTDTGLEPGTGYSYQVRAVNEAGAGDWTAVNSAGATTSAVPDMPVLTATADGQSIVLTWTVPDDNGESISSYQIQRLPSVATDETSQNEWGDDDATTSGAADVIVPEPAGVTTYTDRSLEPGTTYNYRILAVSSEGNGAWSATAKASTPAMAPDRIDVTIKGGDKKVTLTWMAPAANGASISAYQIIQWDPDQPGWKTVRDDLPPSLRTFDVTGLEAGTTYFFRIRAVNSAGEGPWSTFQPEATEPADE